VLKKKGSCRYLMQGKGGGGGRGKKLMILLYFVGCHLGSVPQLHTGEEKGTRLGSLALRKREGGEEEGKRKGDSSI